LTAVDNISFKLAKGEILVLLGHSGCGKTTTLRLIAGLERPDSGEIMIDNQLVAGHGTWIEPENRRVGLVFQDYALFPHLSVEKNILFGLNRYPGDKKSRVAAMLELAGMNGLGKRMPHELSGGQQQRVALARALAPEPDVILLDEPFSNLDAALRHRMRQEVRNMIKQTGVTSVFVTHDQEEALSLADKIAVMFDGHMAQFGTPQQLYNQPVSKRVATFIGEANFISAHADGMTASSVFGMLPLQQAAHGKVDLLLRPEMIAIVACEDGQAQATVTNTQFFGHYLRVEAILDDNTPLMIRAAPWDVYEPGQRVGLRVEREVLALGH